MAALTLAHPHWEALTPATQEAFRLLRRWESLRDFYLAGDSGLALHLGHRFSIDLDFFSQDKDAVDFAQRAALRSLLDDPTLTITSDKDSTFTAAWRGVGISFFRLDSYPLVRPVFLVDGVPLAAPWWGLRYVHFGLSLGLVSLLWWGLGYRVEEQSLTELYWLLGGNLLYYAVGIGLAFALKDNRAFCKYVCPIPALQKIPARFALLKIAGNAETCTDCGACNKMCPMDIRVSDYIKKGQRVLSTECVMCLECVNVCAKDALFANFAIDRVREQAK